MTEKASRHSESAPSAPIYEVRGQRVILDSDLAKIYGVPTHVFNQAVKRNLARFPEDFAFLRAVFARLPAARSTRMDDVLAVLSAHPELAEINANRLETQFIASWKQSKQPHAETPGSPPR
jgi:hypothetical protein